MINYFLYFYKNYNYLYYGLSIYYTICVSYNTYYYCNLVYNFIPLINYDKSKNMEIVMSELNNIDICDKWTLIEKKKLI